MLKVMLIDDETEILEGLRLLLPWEQLGFEVAAAVSRPAEALALMALLRPELVITDIRMPGMTGLELIEKSRAMVPGVRFLILSGYDDFSYARRAIQLGADGYLLKPVNEEELLKEVLRMREAILAARQLEDQGQAALSRAEQLKAQHVLVRVLRGQTAQLMEDEVCHARRVEGIRNFQMVLLKLENGISPEVQRSEADVIRSVFGPAVFQDCIFDADGFFAFFAEGHPLKPGMLGEFGEVLPGRHGGDYAVALGNFSAAGRDKARAFAALCRVFRKDRFYGGPGVYVYDDPGDPGEDVVVPDVRPILREAVLTLDAAMACQAAAQIFSLADKEKMEVHQLTAVLTEFFFFLKGQNGLTVDGATESEFRRVLRDSDRLEVMQRDFCGCLLHLFGQVRGKARQGSGVSVSQIKAYIQAHLGTDIGMEQVATYFHFNPSYFSQMFKKETGMKFTEYITDLRMEEARRLLVHTDKTMAEIAGAIGYMNEKSFFFVFRKKTDTSPSRYRAEHRDT